MEHGLFLDVVGAILTDLSPDSAVQTLVKGIRRLQGVVAVAVFQLDADSARLELRCHEGLSQRNLSVLRSHADRLVIGKAFRDGEVIVVDNVGTVVPLNRRAYEDLLKQHVEIIVAAPLIARGKPLGVLAVYYDQSVPEIHKDKAAIVVFSHLVALAIDNARLYQQRVRAAEELVQLNGQLSELNKQLSQQGELLQRSQAIRELLVETVLGGNGLEGITDAVAGLAGTTVVVEDDHLNVLCVSRTAPGDQERSGKPAEVGLGRFAGDPRVGKHLARVKRARRPALLPDLPEIGLTTPRITAPILVAGDHLGFVSILVNDHQAGELDFALAEQGAVGIALEMMKRKVAFETEQRIRGDFLRSLLAGQLGNLDEASIVIAGTRFNLRALRRVLIVRRDRPDGVRPGENHLDERAALLSGVYQVVERRIAGEYPETILVAEEDSVVVLLGDKSPVSDEAARELADGIVAEMAARLAPETASVGIGGTCECPGDLRRSFVEANRALEVAAALCKRSAAVLFTDLGICGILLRQNRTDELQEFARKYIGPLIGHDETHGGALLQTLSIYVRNDFRLDDTARELHVHPKTVKYRLNRIEELCGVDLRRSDDTMNLQIALRLHRLLT